MFRPGAAKSHSRPDPPVRFPFQTAALVTAGGVPVPSAPLGGLGGLVDLYFVYLSFVCLYFVILYLVVCGFPSAVNPSAVNPSAVNPSAVNPSAVNPSAVNPPAAPRQGEGAPHSRPDTPVRFPFQTGASVTAVGSRSHPAPWGGLGGIG